MKSTYQIKAEQKRKLSERAIRNKKPTETDIDLAVKLKAKYPDLFDNTIDTIRRRLCQYRFEMNLPATRNETNRQRAIQLTKEIITKYPGENIAILALRLGLKTGYSLHYNRKLISDILKFNKPIW